MPDFDMVAVGGSSGGVAAIEAALELEPKLRTAIITDEDRLPYKRTKVSKSFAGEIAPASFRLHEEDWYQSHGVSVLVGKRVENCDRAAKRLLLSDGSGIGYDKLVLAPGSEPEIPAELAGRTDIFFGHSMAHVEELKGAGGLASSAAVVGAGVLGAEVAEQLVKLGLEVSLIGRGRHLMRRELNEPAFERIESLFRAHGVSLHLDDPPARYVKKNKKTGWKVLLSRSATSVEADLLVLCAGMKPRTELAERMGLDVGRGIRVNEYLQTSDNAIFAIGDAAEQADGRVTHLWRDASRQGRIAGRNAVGHWEPYVYLPFRLKCEVFGSYFFSLGRPELERLDAYRTIEFRAGERYAAFYFDDDEAIGVVMMNDKERGDEYMRAIHEGWDPDTCAEFFDAGRIAR